jgi:hypothetical protein
VVSLEGLDRVNHISFFIILANMSGLVGQIQGSVLGRLSTTKESPRPFLRCNVRSVPQKRAVQCTAQQTTYKSPSSSTAATELQRLERFSVVVPDTVLMQKINDLENPKAATVSSGVIVGILRAPTGLREYEVQHPSSSDSVDEGSRSDCP